MNASSVYYNRRYFDAVAADLLEDSEFYRIKSRCAARLYFRDFPKPYGRIFEYGCGLGQNIAALETAVGFDVSPDALAACRRRHVATIDDEVSIPRRAFDYVLCRHVLEHVDQPLRLIQRLLGYLQDDGRLILVSPCERHRRVSMEPDVNRHLYCWTFRTINNLIWQAGGIPIHNQYEPMFGARTYAAFRPLWRLAGLLSRGTFDRTSVGAIRVGDSRSSGTRADGCVTITRSRKSNSAHSTGEYTANGRYWFVQPQAGGVRVDVVHASGLRLNEDADCAALNRAEHNSKQRTSRKMQHGRSHRDRNRIHGGQAATAPSPGAQLVVGAAPAGLWHPGRTAPDPLPRGRICGAHAR